MSENYDRFKELLNANFQFPANYVHKFIGANTPEFRSAVKEFEKQFIGLTLTGEKLSSTNLHVSFTYDYLAASADDVVELTVKTREVPGVLYIL